ncbi:protein-L-isoaspartate O-methyltransferase [bacterium]|nr:protein-L-isoaspartate O-methyltransferase [bacterium]MBU1883071.1 protein-L-isoaspartate O-methyltransferase [bacterium]
MIHNVSNSALVSYLVESGALHTRNIIEAFQNIDRADFVASDVNSSMIYGDFPLQIGHQQTISQPSTVAKMLEMLAPKEGEKILDIGSGSGWTTALLAHIVKDKGLVIGVERIRSVMEFGRANLKKYKFKNAEIMQAGAALGMPSEKFDRILVSAAADEFPTRLIEQLKIGGKLVIPVRNYIFEVTKKADDKLEVLEHYGYSFVPLVY